MMKSSCKKLVVGLEIGTMKVVVLIGEKLSDGSINIIGIGNCLSQGMYKGSVNDLESVVKCVRFAIKQSETMSKCQISSVYLSISGKHISCQNEVGMVPLFSNEVTMEDVENVIFTAKSVRINDKHHILHVIPQEYSIDFQEGIKNPIGLSGVRLQAKVHLITCHNDMTKNIKKAVENCGIKIDRIIFSGLASSSAVLNKDEIDMGVCLVDMGGGTIDITIYTNGALRYTKVIPYAGNVVTSDIAYAFGISLLEAEIIKINHGSTIKNSILHKEENIELISKDGKNIRVFSRQILFEVIEPRYNELLYLVHNEILNVQNTLKKQGMQYNISSGIVLTGGASQIEGLLEYAQDIFKTQVRIGTPLNINCDIEHNLCNPLYSTVIGLLHYEKEFCLKNLFILEKKNLFTNWLKKINNWFRKEF